MKKIKDFIKRNYLIIIAVICFFAFIPPITNLLVTTPSPIGFITPDTQETWIGFFGSIIGGGTLFGVWWTIKKQEEQRNEDFKIQENKRKIDLAIQYMPYINCSIGKIKFSSNKITIPVAIKNTGRGEAKKLHVNVYDGNKEIILEKNMDCIALANTPESTAQFDIEMFYSNKQNFPIITIDCEYTDLIYLENYGSKTCIYFFTDSNGSIDYHINSVNKHNSIL